jgi:sulfoxide reductase heme-binding subunit YedZ
MASGTRAVHIVAATVGFTSLALLWLSVLSGVALRAGWADARVRHSTFYGIHRTLAVLGLALGLTHGLAQLAVPGGPIRLVDQFIPFINPSDPIGVGLGVVALEVMVAMAVTSVVQRRLGFHRWRALHAAAYTAYSLLTGHVLISGSDVAPGHVWGPVIGAWLVTTGAGVATMLSARGTLARIANRLGRPDPRGRVTVGVDPVRCARFGFCEHAAPEVFSLLGDGMLNYRPVAEPHQADAVAEAARVCPARAIFLDRQPTAVVRPQTGLHTVSTRDFTGDPDGDLDPATGRRRGGT